MLAAPAGEQEPRPAAEDNQAARPRIHAPGEELGRDADEPALEEGDAVPEGDQPPKKRTRRGSRGGRSRKRKTAAEAATDASSNGDGTLPAPEESTERRDWDYVPMSEWEDEITA